MWTERCASGPATAGVDPAVGKWPSSLEGLDKAVDEPVELRVVLPEGVDPTVPAVESARSDRRARRDALNKEQTSLNLEIRDLDRASEDVFALDEQLAGLRIRLLEAESEVEASEALLRLTQINLSYAEIAAPMDGVIGLTEAKDAASPSVESYVAST